MFKDKVASNYLFSPMLADFGHSDVQAARRGSIEAIGIDRHGNQIYGNLEVSILLS